MQEVREADMGRKIRITALPLVILALLLCADVALGCPTCKDQLANDPAAQNIARGYFYSILFMLSMPALILAGLSTYFYLLVRQARRKQAETPRRTSMATTSARVAGA
jgi:heme/copper-type cytochrome/quinol oxidase subunit 2